MSRKDSAAYTLLFAGAVCAVCGSLVAASAVMLRPGQERNKQADMQKNVLLASGLLSPDETVSIESSSALFMEKVKAEVIRLKTGEPAPGVDGRGFDQRAEAADPKTSDSAPENDAKVRRIPRRAVVYHVQADAGELMVIPVEGKGLWSTLYGYLALDAADPKLIRGIAFYQHGETPGLGGEIDNPRWQALWKGRRALDDNFNPLFQVIKGAAGPASEAPYHVDGLSGATLTSNGVTHLIRFWTGELGYGPYLRRAAKKGGE